MPSVDITISRVCSLLFRNKTKLRVSRYQSDIPGHMARPEETKITQRKPRTYIPCFCIHQTNYCMFVQLPYQRAGGYMQLPHPCAFLHDLPWIVRRGVSHFELAWIIIAEYAATRFSSTIEGISYSRVVKVSTSYRQGGGRFASWSTAPSSPSLASGTPVLAWPNQATGDGNRACSTGHSDGYHTIAGLEGAHLDP